MALSWKYTLNCSRRQRKLIKDKNVLEKSMFIKLTDAKKLNLNSTCIFADNELLLLVAGAISSERYFIGKIFPKRYQDLSSFQSKFQGRQFFSDKI